MALDPETKALIDGLLRKIARLEQENAALRRQLNLDSSNSSKPPSSDGLKKNPANKKPRNRSLRGKSGKNSGGQKGHKGNTLRQSETPDKTERHRVYECDHCQARLGAPNVIGIEKRQLFDIPEPRLEVTEHQAELCKCPDCGKITKADFPAGINAPAQYGQRIKAVAIYLNVQQLIPEDRLAELITDLFGAPSLCPASITAWVAQKSKDFEPVVEAIKQELKQTYCRHLDETGFRIGGRTQWLHTVSSLTLTCYSTSEKRGDIPIFLKDSQSGVIVHDHFRTYFKTFDSLAHALCNAHHLRELKALTEIDEEPWAKDMSWLLAITNSLKRQAMARGDPALAPPLLQSISQFYDVVVDIGLSFHRSMPPLEKRRRNGRQPRRPGHNLLRRLRDFKDDALRFARDFSVPFTNNLAERDLRMMKLRMKISGGFRSEKGAQIFTSVRSVISTARKQGWNSFKTLTANPSALITALQTA